MARTKNRLRKSKQKTKKIGGMWRMWRSRRVHPQTQRTALNSAPSANQNNLNAIKQADALSQKSALNSALSANQNNLNAIAKLDEEEALKLIEDYEQDEAAKAAAIEKERQNLINDFVLDEQQQRKALRRFENMRLLHGEGGGRAEPNSPNYASIFYNMVGNLNARESAPFRASINDIQNHIDEQFINAIMTGQIDPIFHLETWMKAHCQHNNIKFIREELNFMQHDIKTDFMVGKDKFRQIRVMRTSGNENDCMIHGTLQGVSPSFRRLHMKSGDAKCPRNIVARYVRTELLPKFKIFVPSDNLLSSLPLNATVLSKLSSLLKLDIFYIDLNIVTGMYQLFDGGDGIRVDGTNIMDRGRLYKTKVTLSYERAIVLYNPQAGHWCTVRCNDSFLLDEADTETCISINKSSTENMFRGQSLKATNVSKMLSFT